MRARPYAFLKIGPRWINMALVTDVEDHGEQLVIYTSSDMARMVGGQENPEALDVARRFTISDPDQVTKLRKWLKLNDVE